ncbi:L-threonylcarbamoyladenylate synthase [Flavobacterium sp. N1994]|uniref:L-threonylcarbamoyladenylate synthase n=1 Tax=Flavobacterium sp. N1994 TaxID=2986827 RepID=UPI0029CAC403|nr:L-threonylcarbamoyladenylate synthase [Flavobacterium sp. N1994]
MISTDLYQAAQLLYHNQNVAIPTETVYGLAGNIYSEKAISNIFALKNRPLVNPLIVHIGSRDQVEDLTIDVSELAQKLMDKFWPGSLTLVLKKKETVPTIITGGKDTVAIRMPNHPLTLKLLQLLPFPLAAPSANPFGCISPTSASHVDHYFQEKLPMVLDGGSCQNGLESTIIGFENHQPILYRLGAIALEDIENEIGPIAIKNFEEQHPNAPGMMARHYAPNTKTIMTSNVKEVLHLHQGKRIGLLLFDTKITDEKIVHQEILSEQGNLKEAAANLYAALHRLDALPLDVILVERFPDNQLGRAINDRLKRAATAKNTI